MIDVARDMCQTLPDRAVCEALGVSRSTVGRRRAPTLADPPSQIRARRIQPNALSDEERSRVLDTLNSDRFADLAAAQVFAQLLDEGTYLCSPSTMYRLLRVNAQVHERRRVARHPEYHKPELLATRPREVFSWDITKLRGPEPGIWYSLLVMIDIFSRYVVGWKLVRSANGEIATEFIRSILERENIAPAQAVVHADRGTEMTAKPVCDLLDSLGVSRSHSRPRVSDDNPYSESQFRTMKYCPTFPERFGSLEDARAFMREFFPWYNNVHRHSGIKMLTPATVHHGLENGVLQARYAVMSSGYDANPNRFIAGKPKQAQLPRAVWINQPADEAA